MALFNEERSTGYLPEKQIPNDVSFTLVRGELARFGEKFNERAVVITRVIILLIYITITMAQIDIIIVMIVKILISLVNSDEE